MSGGNSGGIESYLPIAAALAATVATDGAAAPWLGEALGAEAGTAGATMLGAGAMGALTGGATSALRGGNILQGAAIGGLGGAAMGGIGAAYGGGTPTTEGLVPTIAEAPVSGTLAAPVPLPSTPFDPMQLSQEGYKYVGPGAAPFMGSGGASLGASNVASVLPGELGDIPLNAAGNLAYNPTDITTPTNLVSSGAQGLQGLGGGSSGIMKLLADNKGIAALGGTALLGTLMQRGNNKYGTPSNQPYDGPLSKFKYDPNQYHPTTAAQPNPAYRPVYPNYVRTPYNAYAAEGGAVKAMASGGIAMVNPSVGPVEQMSRDNAMGNNQMFPTAAINSPAFSSATNTPVANNLIASTSDADVDPYTGAQRFAIGGGIAAKPKKQNNMAAIDDYVAQAQSDPATVMGKAKDGDWNAMIALNKVNNTPEPKLCSWWRRWSFQVAIPMMVAC